MFFKQLQPPVSLSISVSRLSDGPSESKANETSNEVQSSNETNVSQSSPILPETISPSSPWHSVTTDEQS